MDAKKVQTTLLAILACLLWSSAFVGIKIGLPYTTPLRFAGIRFFTAGILVLPLAFRYNPHYLSVFRKNFRFILTLGALQTFLQYALFYTGISKVPGAIGAIVIGSGPLFVALVAHAFMPNDRITPRKLLVILFGLTGVVLVSLGRNNGIDGEAIVLAGVLILVGNNIISGFTNVLVARERRKIPPLVLSSASMIFGGAMLILFSVPVEGFNPELKPLPYYLSLGWLSMLSAVAISIWITLLKRPGVLVSDLNLWKFLIPVSGAMLAWLILPGEQPDPVSVAGMLITGSALVLLNLLNRRAMRRNS